MRGERAPATTGNRYLICFTSEKQAKKAPVAPLMDEAHEAGPGYENLNERYGKRRQRGTTATWKTEAGDTACASTGKVRSYVRHSRAVGGIIFDPAFAPPTPSSI